MLASRSLSRWRPRRRSRGRAAGGRRAPTAKPSEKIIVPPSCPRPIWMSSPSAAIAAERISMRVPMHERLVQHEHAAHERAPSASGRAAAPPGSGSDSVPTSPDGGPHAHGHRRTAAHHDPLDQRLPAIEEVGHAEARRARRRARPTARRTARRPSAARGSGRGGAAQGAPATLQVAAHATGAPISAWRAPCVAGTARPGRRCRRCSGCRCRTGGNWRRPRPGSTPRSSRP